MSRSDVVAENTCSKPANESKLCGLGEIFDMFPDVANDVKWLCCVREMEGGG